MGFKLGLVSQARPFPYFPHPTGASFLSLRVLLHLDVSTKGKPGGRREEELETGP